jgi:hypothetical protein
MDDCCNTDSFVAAGIGDQLHDGRSHSCFAGDCHHRYSSRLHSEGTRVVAVLLSHESIRKREVP